MADTVRLHAFYYNGQAIARPPPYPIPGKRTDDETEGSKLTHPLPNYMGSTFAALCEFHRIVQEIAAVYLYRGGWGTMDHVPLAFAESKYQSLLHWLDNHASDMGREPQCPMHTIFFQ